MKIGSSPLERLEHLSEKDVGTYHDRILRTLFILKDAWPNDPEYCIDKCYQAAIHCTYRQPNHKEIENLADFVWRSEGRETQVRPIPTTDHALIAEVSKKGNLQMLKEQSKPHPPSIGRLLDDFYPNEDPWLCLAKDVFGTEIKRKSDWQKTDLTEYQFFLANPLKDSTSRRADNISEFRYLTYESDELGRDWDVHASVILNLAKMVKLSCAHYSGGKSIHALFKISGYSQDYIERFKDRVFMLGGDPCTAKPQQFCRLPMGWRGDKAQPQKILYYG